MKVYTYFVLLVLLFVGFAPNALATDSSSLILLEKATQQHLLSARTQMNDPNRPERGQGRRDLFDTTHDSRTQL